MKMLTYLFLLIAVMESVSAYDISSDRFLYLFNADPNESNYKPSHATFLTNYSNHIQTVLEGGAVCIINCDVLNFSGAKGFYRKGGLIRFGLISHVNPSNISLLPESITTARNEQSQLIEPLLYESVELGMYYVSEGGIQTITENEYADDGGLVFVPGLGGFGMCTYDPDTIEPFGFYHTPLTERDRLPTGFAGSLSPTASTALARGYTYISTNPTAVDGILGNFEIRITPNTALNIAKLYIFNKTGTNTFTVAQSYDIGIVKLTATTTIKLQLDDLRTQIPIQAGQYFGFYSLSTGANLAGKSSSINPRLWRKSGSGGGTFSLINYTAHLHVEIIPVMPARIPGVTVIEAWTGGGTAYLKLDWVTGNICYTDTGCYDYDFTLQFKQVGESEYGKPIYLALGWTDAYLYLKAKTTGMLKVYLSNRIIKDYQGINLEVPIQVYSR